jgi:multiple sugar transport system substrate-binding protein
MMGRAGAPVAEGAQTEGIRTMQSGNGVSRRGLIGSAGAGLVGVALAACGGAPAGGDGQASQNAKPVTMSFMSWRPIAMDRFEKKWTEWGTPRKITINIERIANSGDRDTQLTARLAADQAPDATDSNSGTDFARCEAGHFMVLDKLMSRDKVSQEKDYGLTYAEKWRSKTYQLSYWVEPYGIYYNKTMFKKKGIPDPWEKKDKPGEWTLEEMTEAARRATDPANDEWGLDWSRGYDQGGIGSFIWSQGSTHYNYDPMGWTLDNPASIQAHQWMVDWWAKNKWNIDGPEKTRMMQPWGGKALDTAGGMTPFANGKVAIHYRSVNDWARMWPVVKDQFEWDVLPMPSVNGKVGAVGTAGHPVNMWSKTKNPDQVWEFLKFLIGDDFQAFMSQEQILVPAKLSHQNKFFRPPPQYPYQHATVFPTVFKKPVGTIWRNFRSAEDGTVYNEYRDKIYKGELSVQNGLKEATARLNNQIEWGGGENPFKGLKLPIAPK